ncbi:MAG: hypothetical protein JNK32_03075 [Anaerolineales bacterium]|nr:hypothetical protein [Anaerolineales bacterium]
MKPKLSLFAVFIVTLCITLACGGTAQMPTSTLEPTLDQPTQEAATETSTPASATETPLPAPGPESVSGCNLPPRAFTNVGLGLPKPSQRLPSVGDVTTIVLFVDFPDVPAAQSPNGVFNLVSPGAENFFKAISYGRMNYILQPHFVWLRLSQPAAFYGGGIGTFEGHRGFIQEAVNLADAEVDFSKADSVLVLTPPEAIAVAYGPAFGGDETNGYSADGKVFANGVTSGADLPGWGYLWLNHETGHNLSLPDLYAYQYDSANYDDQHRFVGGFGLMGYIDGHGPEFFAFERWQLGWLDDNQIICQTEAEGTAELTPIEIAGSTKAVIIPLSETKAVVVESRRRMGYDQDLVKEGALVYTVDTSIFSGEGPVVVYPILENDPYRDQSPLGVGESVTVEGVTITVLEARPETDIVQITVVK